MPSNYYLVEKEVAAGRLWRAKELLTGRLANASYDQELFKRLARVLQAMGDDDASGKFHLLAGNVEGEEGELARRFLLRRKAKPLTALWAQMPTAARRLIASNIPEGTEALLIEIGHEPNAIKSFFHQFAIESGRPARTRVGNRRMVHPLIGWVFIGTYGAVLLLGLKSIVELIMPVARRLFQ